MTMTTTTYACKKLTITVSECQTIGGDGEPTGKTYEVPALLLPDGRLFVRGAGVDGRDSLFGAIEDFEPNGTDRVESIDEVGGTATLAVADVVAADHDNVEYGESLLTDAERQAAE